MTISEYNKIAENIRHVTPQTRTRQDCLVLSCPCLRCELGINLVILLSKTVAVAVASVGLVATEGVTPISSPKKLATIFSHRYKLMTFLAVVTSQVPPSDTVLSQRSL